MAKSAFIFPGQGAQYVGMGRELYDTFQAAKEIYEKASDILGFDITRLCFKGPAEELTATGKSQPAIFVTSIAALRVFKSEKDITPSACAGLSLGEYSALVAAETISFEDAVKLVRLRGRFMEEASAENPGRMAAVMGLELSVIEEIAKDAGAEIANLNCPGQVIISGSHGAVGKAMDSAKVRGAAKCVPLEVSGPFHSSLMDKAASRLKEELENISFESPKVPFISNVTADYEDSVDSIKENLALQVNHRTLWEASVRRMVQNGISDYYEIGPGKVLKGLLRKIDKSLILHNIDKPADIHG